MCAFKAACFYRTFFNSDGGFVNPAENLKTVEVQVSKEAFELGEGLQKFVASTKQALADGWQPGQDLPVVLASALEHLIPAIQGAEKIGAETANKQAFANAIYLSLSPIAFDFVK